MVCFNKTTLVREYISSHSTNWIEEFFHFDLNWATRVLKELKSNFTSKSYLLTFNSLQYFTAHYRPTFKNCSPSSQTRSTRTSSYFSVSQPLVTTQLKLYNRPISIIHCTTWLKWFSARLLPFILFSTIIANHPPPSASSSSITPQAFHSKLKSLLQELTPWLIWSSAFQPSF